jgi:hypothetical protein
MRTARAVLRSVIPAVLVASATIASASVPDSGGIYTGCYFKALGTIRLIDTAIPAQKCLAGFETLVTWNRTGLQGPAGSAGTPGAAGAPGAPGANGANGTDVTASAINPISDSRCGFLGGVEVFQDGVSKAVVCSIQGPSGAKGDAGVAGLQGVAGPTGPQGPQGAQGPQGLQGLTGPPGGGPGGPTAPICRGRPGGTCSATTTQACAYDADCPGSESCVAPSPRFVDNGNGTVTDKRTCLVWEKKTGTIGSLSECPAGPNCADPHNVNNTYQWSSGFPFGLNGTVATVFLKQLNDEAFAGHTDWRLPTNAGSIPHLTGQDPELESIVLAPYPCGTSPCIAPALGPTAATSYWSSSSGRTTIDPNIEAAWVVDFALGISNVAAAVGYNAANPVRAVRGGK